MDVNGATFLCEHRAPNQVPAPAPSSPGGSQSPMYLVVLSGGIPGAMLRLSPGGNRLGRASDNTLQLPDASISRYHAFLGVDEEGQVRLTDLGSTNGSFQNGRRLPENTPVLVHDGDRLQFGSDVIVKFIRPDPCEEQFQREMFERTVRDPLTGLYNRAFFLAQFGPLADRGGLRGLGIAVLMLDIDHFKRINDAHGHEVGDQVLREVAGVLRQATRADDLVARYGGEEFVIALPVAAPDQATDRAERLRASLASRRILAGGVPLRVTASLGLAFAPPGRPRSIGSLISTADQGLYQAKNSGRDRIVFSHELASRVVDADTAIAGED
ncbi:diguanylate cyclase [Tundrisphaera sp. TA3]|uniref:diguanylate cyclase n=1 Tax=Tundrisphaera sp. TA3 TaxID=3435775 RepID=UPI003EBF3D0B